MDPSSSSHRQVTLLPTFPDPKRQRLASPGDTPGSVIPAYMQPRSTARPWSWFPELIMGWFIKEQVPPMPDTDHPTSEPTLPPLPVEPEQAFAALVSVVHRELQNLWTPLVGLLTREKNITKEVGKLTMELLETDRLHSDLVGTVKSLTEQLEKLSDDVENLAQLHHGLRNTIHGYGHRLNHQEEMIIELNERLEAAETRAGLAEISADQALAAIQIHHPDPPEEEEPEEEDPEEEDPEEEDPEEEDPEEEEPEEEPEVHDALDAPSDGDA